MVRWWTAKKNFWTYLAVLNLAPGTFWDWVQKQKTNLDFQRIFDNLLANISFPTTFMNALIIFLAIYQSQSKHSRLVLQNIFFKKNFMAPFYGRDSNVSRIQSHYEETVHFLPLGPQGYLVLISSISKDWRLRQPWNHSLVLNPGPLDWKSSTLTTRPSLQLQIRRF